MSKRKSYLFSKLTGDIVETYEPDSFMGSSNRFSDGEPVYIKLTPIERRKILSEPQRNRFDHLTWLHYYREGRRQKQIEAKSNRRAKVTGSRNPRPKFGQRKATPAKPRKASSAALKRKAFGKRKTTPIKALAAGRAIHAIAAYAKGENGEKWYWDGVSLNTERAKAALYADWRQAERVLASIENRVPSQVRAVSVIPVTWL